MKTFVKIMAILGALLLIVLIGAILFLKSFDWDRARPWVNEKVSVATGRNFVIGGHLAATWTRPASEAGWRSWIPWPTFTALNVQIDNPEWAKRKQFATADAMAFEVEILPLLVHKIIIPHISLTNPVLDFERTNDARNTWTFKRSNQENTKWDLQLQELAFTDGVIDVTDAPTRIDMRALIRQIGNPIALGDVLDRRKAQSAAIAADKAPAAKGKSGEPKVTEQANAKTEPKSEPKSEPNPVTSAAVTTAEPYGFGLQVSGTYRDAKLNGTGKIGGALSLIDRQKPFPLQADVHLGDNHVVVQGMLTDPGKLAALDLQLSLAAPSLGDLYDLIGVALPETPRFRINGHLTGQLSANGNRFKYDKFTGVVGKSDLSGTLEFSSAPPRKRLTGTVHSKRLALADLGPAVGAPTVAVPVTKSAVKQPADKALPTATFRTDRWRAMDLDVHFSGGTIIRNAALPISDMSTHIIMNDGVLSFDPLKFGVAGGSMTGTIRLDGRQMPLNGKMDIAARHLQLKRLFPTFAPMNTSFGEINGDAKLSGRGNSTAALAATSTGEVKLLINNGAISNTLLEEAGLNVANIVMAKLFGDKVVQINCAAADFVVKDGLLDSRVFTFDTSDALIEVDGTINLANEQMNLNVHPHTKGFRVFTLRSPLYVKGTFKHPDVGVEKGPLVMRAGAALALGAVNPLASLLALLVPSNNQPSPCPAMMQTARQGLKGGPTIVR